MIEELGEGPSLLCSIIFLKGFLATKHRLRFRNWRLDSGAFSVRAKGSEISLPGYIDMCHELRERDPKLVEIFALDVIGDWRATLKNTEAMWAAGVEAIPTYHFSDENEDVLRALARDYPKIALGGMADLRIKPKLAWSQRCFDLIWPARIHGFGLAEKTTVLALPWDSVDASSWKKGPLRFGNWKTWPGALGHITYGIRHGWIPDLNGEVLYYMNLEDRHRHRWAEIKKRDLPGAMPLELCLASDFSQGPTNAMTLMRAIGKDHTR